MHCSPPDNIQITSQTHDTNLDQCSLSCVRKSNQTMSREATLSTTIMTSCTKGYYETTVVWCVAALKTLTDFLVPSSNRHWTPKLILPNKCAGWTWPTPLTARAPPEIFSPSNARVHKRSKRSYYWTTGHLLNFSRGKKSIFGIRNFMFRKKSISFQAPAR